MWILACVFIGAVVAYVTRKKIMSNSYEDAMRLRDERARIQTNHFEEVVRLFDEGYKIHCLDELNKYLREISKTHISDDDNLKIAKFLLEKGANIHAPNEYSAQNMSNEQIIKTNDFES